VASR